MQIVRLAKGENDFAIANVTIGQLKMLKKALQFSYDYGNFDPSLVNMLQRLKEYDLDRIEPFGNQLLGVVRSRIASLKSQVQDKQKQEDKDVDTRICEDD